MISTFIGKVSRPLIRLSVIFVALLLSAATLSAQTSGGFTVSYQDYWPANAKMRYIRVVIKPVAGVSPSERDFQVVATHDNYLSGIISTTTIPIRKGDTSAVGEIYVPSYSGYNFSLHTELDGDGRYNRGDFAHTSNYEYNSGASTDCLPRFVIASSEVSSDENSQFNVLDRRLPKGVFKNAFTATKDFPALDELELWYEASSNNYGGDRDFMTVGNIDSARIAAMSLASLPSKWFAYEGLHLVIITYQDLKTLAQNHPGKLLAIERWVAAGGRLVVSNCGSKLQQSEAVLKLLGDDNQQVRNSRWCNFPKQKLANEAQIKATRESLVQQIQTGQSIYLDWSEELSKVHARRSRKRFKEVMAQKKLPEMLSVDFAQGDIVCLSDKASDWSQSSNKTDEWGELLIFLESAKTSQTNHGLLNIDFNKGIGFPEFAEPPRYVFEFSIMAYLLLVGPIAFLVLKKIKRLNLMFVLVPLVSLVVCSSILGWAIFAEGFETRVNQFTFTRLNQKTGRQTTATLSHIYSGVTPSPYQLKGPTYGIVNLPRSGRYQRFAWSGAGEEISEGEIRARTNHQLRTACSNETDQKLEFSFEGSGESESVTISNGFDTTINYLVFKAKPIYVDQVWVVESVPPGATRKAKLMKVNEAAFRFRYLIDQRSESASSVNHFNHYSLWQETGLDVSDQYRVVRNLGSETIKSMLLCEQGKSRYIALTERATNFEPTIENMSLESEVHVILGER